MAATPVVSKNKDQLDWISISSRFLPFVSRIVDGEELQFVSVRMAENNVLHKYSSHFNLNVLKFSPAKSLFMTDVEAELFNKTIRIHHDKLYQEDTPFSTTDFIVRIEDAREFYKFIEFCYIKLYYDIAPGRNDRCGYICVSDEFDMSAIPYILKDNVKYTPLCFFKTKIDLTPFSEKIEGWSIAYLKFCFKVMDIDYKLFQSIDSYSMIKLKTIKPYFSKFTRFHKLWPPNFDRWDLMNQKRSIRLSSGVWVRPPLQVVSAIENIHGQQASQMDSSIMAQGSSEDHDLESSPSRMTSDDVNQVG